MKSRGVLITFEGGEGSGKTTQMARLGRWLRSRGHRVELTCEPDGTVLGAGVRRLFERAPQPLTEVFLFLAARHQHVAEKLRPWLAQGRLVLCDRYTDATVAYQGYGRGIDPETIRELNVQATGGVLPDLTLLLDVVPPRAFVASAVAAWTTSSVSGSRFIAGCAAGIGRSSAPSPSACA